MADIDLKSVLADTEFFYRNGDNPDGMTPAALATLMVAQSAIGTAATLDFDTDDTAAANSDTRVPTQAAMVAYVAANGGGTGNVSDSDTDASGWAFVVDEDDMVSDSATQLPTQQSVKAYVDSRSTLTTSDLGKVNVSTVGGVTIIDVDDLLTSSDGSFTDAAFRVQNVGDPTKQLAFDLSGFATATTRTFSFPDASGAVVVADVYQEMGNKKFYQTISIGNGGTNDGTRGNTIEHFGVSLAAPHYAFLAQGGTTAVPAQTAAASTIGRIAARGRHTSDYSSGDAGQILFTAEEAVTGSARGTDFRVRVTPLTTTTITTGLRVSSTAVPAVLSRGGMLAGAGSTIVTDSMATGYGLECRTDAIGYGVGTGGTQTQGTSKSTTVVLNKPCGSITMHNANLSGATIVSFQLTNSYIDAGDVVHVCIESGGTSAAYLPWTSLVSSGSCQISVRNMTAGILGESPVINFSVIKGVTT